MGWFDGASAADWAGDKHGHGHHSHKSSPKRHHSSGSGSGGIFGIGDHRHNSSRSSFFGMPGSLFFSPITQFCVCESVVHGTDE